MAKRQLNVRISNLTRYKLDFLSEYYGTQGEVVAIAIDRLYRDTRYGDPMFDLTMFVQEQHKTGDMMPLDLGEEKIRVLIVDDVQEARENLRKLLGSEPDIKVVGTAASGEKGIVLAEELQPHIVLMDMLMPGMGGLVASQSITQQVPYTRVVMTAVHGAEALRRAMLAGARDCLAKPFSAGDLLSSIRRVYAMSPYP
jgi:CheY-like chemotaxis protein